MIITKAMRRDTDTVERVVSFLRSHADSEDGVSLASRYTLLFSGGRWLGYRETPLCGDRTVTRATLGRGTPRHANCAGWTRIRSRSR